MGNTLHVRRFVLAAAVLALALVLPCAAGASTRQLRIFQDDRMLLYSGPLVRDVVLDQARQMGVNVIRTQFVWRNIALSKVAHPDDPAAYGSSWSAWDSLVIEAHRRGMKVLGTITGPAPTWYAGLTDRYYYGSRYPNAKAFGQFVTAVGRRYSGHAKASTAAHVAGLFDSCTPIPPLISCGPTGPVIGPPPPSGGGGSGGGDTGSSPPPPPPGTGDQSPPPPPNSGPPSPPTPPGTPLPRIDMWSIYNEPNHPLFVSPQRDHGVLVSPSIYRSLYRAGYRALVRTGHRRDTILIGEVLPIGSDGHRATSTTTPLTFARELFCLNGKGRRHPGCGGHFAPLRASGWALHAYYRSTGPFSKPPGPNDITPSSTGRLTALLRRAVRAHRLRGGTALWDTEDGSQTRPPDPKGTSLSRQAQYINEAEYLAWKRRDVRAFSQYLWADENQVWAFQSGLTFDNGKPKPALAAYRLPIYVKKAGRGVVVWGRVPRSGVVTIHPSRGHAVRLHARGYFTKRLRTRAPRYWLTFGDWRSRTAAPNKT